MGAPNLKIKKQLNYRKGPTSGGCSGCNYFKFVNHAEGRCEKIGVNPGRAYRILGHYICDLYDGSKLLKRLRGY